MERNKVCGRCGHTWCSHTDVPVRCPRCGTYHWQGQPTTNTCAICGHTWFSRTDQVPLRCPSCKTRSWMNGPRRGRPAALGSKMDEEASKNVVDLYMRGEGCIRISMMTEIPLSTVIRIVRSAVCSERAPRM